MNDTIDVRTQLESAVALSLPDLPEPVQIEIEFTNSCNARCVACPRDDMAPAGMIAEETIDLILDSYDAVDANYSINKVPGQRNRYPSVTVAGGGDLSLHPRAFDLLARIARRGRSLHVITNASRLTPAKADMLIEANVSSIAVSFWGIHRAEYEAAMRLPFERTLSRVEHLAAKAREASVPFCVIWVKVPEITSTSDEVLQFWSERGIDVDLTDNYAWNRAGLLRKPTVADALAYGSLPDERKRIWCSDFFFSDAYRWTGDAVICCCNYFTSKPIVLGNIYADGLTKIQQRKAEMWQSRPLPRMCQTCVLPRKLRAEWLAGPWLKVVSDEERTELLRWQTAQEHDEM